VPVCARCSLPRTRSDKGFFFLSLTQLTCSCHVVASHAESTWDAHERSGGSWNLNANTQVFHTPSHHPTQPAYSYVASNSCAMQSFFYQTQARVFFKEAADMQSVKGAQCLDTGVPLSWPWHCRRLQLQAARFLSQKTPSKSPQEVLSPTHVLRLLHADCMACSRRQQHCMHMSSLHVEGTPTHWRLLPVVTRPLLPPPVANPILCACARTSSRPHANA
jgi:hypothetical protein